MRRHVLAALALIMLAIVESSLLPTLLGPSFRPNLVLIAASTWAAIRGPEGFFWAAGGGMMLDLLSGGGIGLNATAYMLGNLAAVGFDRIPIPSRTFRTTNWVAITTAVAHTFMLVWLGITGHPIDFGFALTNVIIPMLLLNPSLALLAYTVLSRMNQKLMANERFAVH